MRHYELCILVHPDQSEQVPAMIERLKTLVAEQNGKIECGHETIEEIENGFRFNDAILRHLTVKTKHAETAPSVMMKAVEKEEAKKVAAAEAAAAEASAE